MRYKIGVLLLLSGFLVPRLIFAQDCHIALYGKVTELETGAPLPYATIYVKEVQRGTQTDEKGRFVLSDLCEKTAYTVSVSHLECAHETRIVELRENVAVNFALPHHIHALGEVMVLEKATVLTAIAAKSEIEGIALQNSQSAGLGAAIRDVAGVSLLKTGATIAKPVIQGMSGNRIALLTQGVVLEGQQWGTEHAPEIDPFAAGKITVVKGAEGVRYGPSAMAGAILVEPAPLRDSLGVGGWIAGSANSNGRGGSLAGSVDWKLAKHKAAFRAQGSLKRSGNLQTPDYFLENTGASEANFSLYGNFSLKKWDFESVFSQYNQEVGILRAAHTGNVDDLKLAIAAERPIRNADVFSYTIGRPYQKIHHDLLRLTAKKAWNDLWRLKTQFAFQYNNRREYDAHAPFGSTPNSSRAQIQFYNFTNTMEAVVSHLPIRHWSGEAGAQGFWQYNQTGTGGYVPDHLSRGGSVWALERWRRYPHPVEYEIGLRGDYRHIHVTDSVGRPSILDTTLVFANISASGGILWRFWKGFSLQAHSGLAWRPPYPTELFARGVHHGAAAFEQGNASLVSEKSWTNSLTLVKNSSGWQGSLNVFYNRMEDFIYLNPENEYALTVRGAFPKYSYEQADATFRGLEATVWVPVLAGFSVEARGSVLRASRVVQGTGDGRAWLPLMPSDRFGAAILWESKQKTRFRVGFNHVALQSRIPPEGLLKAAPEAYTLWDVEANHQFRLGKTRIDAGLRMENMADARFRDYMDYFRFFANAPGRDISLRLRWHF